MNEPDFLRRRFGRLVAAHRRRKGMTQDALALATDLSTDMISQIEGGKTGASFPSIERLAAALGVDPSQLFATDALRAEPGSIALTNLTAKLSALAEHDLAWLDRLIDQALRPRSKSI